MGRPSRTAAVKARDSVTSAYNYNPLADEVEVAHSEDQRTAPSKGKSTKRKAADDDDDSQDEFRIDGNTRVGMGEEQGSGMVDEDDDDASSLVISEQDQEDSMEEDENGTPQPSSSKRASKSKSKSKSTTKSIGGSGSKSKGGGGGGSGVASTSKSTSDNRSGGGGPLNKIDNSRIKFIKTSAKSSKSHVAPGFMEIVPTFNPSFPSNHSIKVKSKLQRKPLHFLQKNFLKLTGSKNQWPESESQPDLTYQDPNEEDFENQGMDGDGDGEGEGLQSLNEIILEFVMTLSLFNLDQVRDVGWFPGKVDVRTMMKWTKELESRRDDGMELDQDQEEEDTDERLIGMPLHGRALRHRLKDLKILSPSQAVPYVDPAPVPSNAPRPAPNLHVPAPENSSTEDPDVDVDPNPDSDPKLFLEANPNLTGDSIKISLGPIDLQTEVSLQRGQSLRLDSIPLSSTSSKDRMEIDSDNNDQDSEIEGKKKWWKKSKKGTHLLNVGGLVYDLDFRPLPHHLCQGSEFLAISTGTNKNDPFPRINYGMKLKDPTPDSIQIWEIQSDLSKEDQENETIEKKKIATTKKVASKKGKEKEIDNQDNVESDDGGAKDRNGKAKEVLRICTDFGKAIKLRWFPNGHDYLSQPQSSESSNQSKPLRRLGLLAAIFLDGTTRIFSVPHPEDIKTSINNNTSKSKSKSQDEEKQPICIKLDPILTLNIPSKVPSALAWGGERLAVAFVDGWIATWDIGRLLNQIKDFDRDGLNDMKPSKPSHLFQAHDSTILSLDFIRSPSLQAGKEDENGEETTRSGKDKGKTKTKGKEKQGNSSLREEIDHDKNPSQLISSGVDGRITLHDLRDPNASYSPHTVRDFALTPVYYPANQGLIADDPDGSIKTVSNRMGSFGHSSVLAYFTGKILDLSTSGYHPFIAGGSADGSVRVVNGVRSLLRKVIRNRVIYPVYQLEMNRETGQLRMLDNLNPIPATFTMPTEEEMKKSKVSIHKSNAHGYSAAGWHPSISIRCLKWSPNIGRSLLLASGTGCGLVRVDWVDNKGAEMETDNEIGKTLLNKIKTEIERLKKEERGDKTKSRQKKSRAKKDNNDDDVDEEMDELEG